MTVGRGIAARPRLDGPLDLAELRPGDYVVNLGSGSSYRIVTTTPRILAIRTIEVSNPPEWELSYLHEGPALPEARFRTAVLCPPCAQAGRFDEHGHWRSIAVRNESEGCWLCRGTGHLLWVGSEEDGGYRPAWQAFATFNPFGATSASAIHGRPREPARDPASAMRREWARPQLASALWEWGRRIADRLRRRR